MSFMQKKEFYLIFLALTHRYTSETQPIRAKTETLMILTGASTYININFASANSRTNITSQYVTVTRNV